MLQLASDTLQSLTTSRRARDNLKDAFMLRNGAFASYKVATVCWTDKETARQLKVFGHVPAIPLPLAASRLIGAQHDKLVQKALDKGVVPVVGET